MSGWSAAGHDGGGGGGSWGGYKGGGYKGGGRHGGGGGRAMNPRRHNYHTNDVRTEGWGDRQYDARGGGHGDYNADDHGEYRDQRTERRRGDRADRDVEPGDYEERDTNNLVLAYDTNNHRRGGPPTGGGKGSGKYKGEKGGEKGNTPTTKAFCPVCLCHTRRKLDASLVCLKCGRTCQESDAQDFSPSVPARTNDRHSSASHEGGSTLSAASAEVSQAYRDMVKEAFRAVEERSVVGLTSVLSRLSSAENVGNARTDPSWKKVLEKTAVMFSMIADIPNTTPKDLTELVFVLGKLQVIDASVNSILHSVADKVKVHVESLEPHNMSGMVWGFASLSVRNDSIMSVTAAEVVNKIQSFDQRQLSNTAWAFAKCGLWNDQLVTAIADECLRKIGSFTSQSLAHISWSMAQWSIRREDLMDAISQEAQRKISECGPPSLGMTAWSFASLQLKSPELFSAISTEAQAKITHFKLQDLAHLAWAFANLRIHDVPLFNLMAEEIQQNIKGTLPPELSNIAWAFAKNNLANDTLMTCIARECVCEIRNFKPAEIAMLTWAFAVAGLQHKDLMLEIGLKVADSLNMQLQLDAEAARARSAGQTPKQQKGCNRYSPPQLSHIAWAFGALSLRHSELFATLSVYIHEDMKGFKAQGLSNIAWAFAMVAFRDESILRLIAPEITAGVAELRPLALARCAWAYRVLAVPIPSLMEAISKEAVVKLNDFPMKALGKLVDAIYLVPEAKEANILQAALDKRTAEVVEIYTDKIGTPTVGEEGSRPDEQEYNKGIVQLGLSDAGIVGTPMLLRRLNIDMPPYSFIEKCRQQQALDRDEGATASNELSAAEVDLTWTWTASPEAVWTWTDFFTRYAGEESSFHTKGQVHRKDGADESYVKLSEVEAIPDNLALIAVDLGGRFGKTEPAFTVLAEIHSALRALGGPDAIVTGSVQIFSSQVPSISTIGALWQFKVLFPSVEVEFLEQAGAIGEA